MNKWKDSGARVHFLDHWPFTRRCRSEPYGGGWFHLGLTWSARRKEVVFRLLYKILCQRGRHSYSLCMVGHVAWKECHRCKAPGTLTPEELEVHQYQWLVRETPEDDT